MLEPLMHDDKTYGNRPDIFCGSGC